MTPPYRDDSDRWATDDRRIKLLDWALSKEGAYYRWGGKGETIPEGVFLNEGITPPKCRELYDCSGLITCAMVFMGLPDKRQKWNAAGLFLHLQPVSVSDVRPMDLAFYGQLTQQGPRIDHVMFHWEDGRVYGACQGNSGTLTLATAHRVGARVRFRNSHMYRPDFRGFRKFPLPPRPKDERDDAHDNDTAIPSILLRDLGDCGFRP